MICKWKTQSKIRNVGKREFLGRSKCSWYLEDRSCVSFGYVFTEKLAQVTTAQWAVRYPAVKCPGVIGSWWCLVVLSPQILSLCHLLWMGMVGRHWRTLKARWRTTHWVNPLEPQLCTQAGGLAWGHIWDAGYQKTSEHSREWWWSLLPRSSCRVTIITAQMEVGLLLQPGQELAWCMPHACMWLGCIMWMISPS